MQTRADRLHAAISKTYEGFYAAVDEASFERRAGHARLLFPSVPIRLFNGVIVESQSCAGIADSISEVEERGLPCGVQVRAERTQTARSRHGRGAAGLRAGVGGTGLEPVTPCL
jgi:hypothetical protein